MSLITSLLGVAVVASTSFSGLMPKRQYDEAYDEWWANFTLTYDENYAPDLSFVASRSYYFCNQNQYLNWCLDFVPTQYQGTFLDTTMLVHMDINEGHDDPSGLWLPYEEAGFLLIPYRLTWNENGSLNGFDFIYTFNDEYHLPTALNSYLSYITQEHDYQYFQYFIAFLDGDAVSDLEPNCVYSNLPLDWVTSFIYWAQDNESVVDELWNYIVAYSPYVRDTDSYPQLDRCINSVYMAEGLYPTDDWNYVYLDRAWLWFGLTYNVVPNLLFGYGNFGDYSSNINEIYQNGFSAGKDYGYGIGKAEGESIGYLKGQSSVTDETTSVFNLFGAVASVPISVLNGLAPFTFWDVSLIGIAVTFLFIALILWIVRKFI